MVGRSAGARSLRGRCAPRSAHPAVGLRSGATGRCEHRRCPAPLASQVRILMMLGPRHTRGSIVPTPGRSRIVASRHPLPRTRTRPPARGPDVRWCERQRQDPPGDVRARWLIEMWARPLRSRRAESAACRVPPLCSGLSADDDGDCGRAASRVWCQGHDNQNPIVWRALPSETIIRDGTPVHTTGTSRRTTP
jgi:hypothetical protein